jgi:hypothetical protein
VYEYAFFTPEMTFDYGKTTPVLYNNGTLLLPNESVYGVLVSPEKVADFKAHFIESKIEAIELFDMNPQLPESSAHKTRLARVLYKVTTN